MIIGDGPNMNGCSYCNVPQQEHYRWYSDLIGWHTWQEPDNMLRKQRWMRWMNAREANKRRKLVEDTLWGMNQLFTTNLHQELDPEQEMELVRLLSHAQAWMESREA